VINNAIKIVIWDLDDTFWSGTFSEGDDIDPYENIEIVIELAKRGIISSIVSKNDYEETMRYLEKHEIDKYFVLPQISYSMKGDSVKRLLNTIGLRPENALFLDDNFQNRSEVRAVNPNLNIESEEFIPDLLENRFLSGTADIELKRLLQYKGIEKRVEISSADLENIDFLKSSALMITFVNENINNARILELNERANQLNYTKKKLCADELEFYVKNEKFDVTQVFLSDRYGDYGNVGFYILDIANEKLLYYVFSCRAINTKVETYIYNRLKRPKLAIIPKVISDLAVLDIDWFTIANSKQFIADNVFEHTPKIQCVGGCDLEQIFKYARNIDFVKNPIINNEIVHLDNSIYLNRNFKTVLPHTDSFYKINLPTEIKILYFSLFMDMTQNIFRRNEYYFSIGDEYSKHITHSFKQTAETSLENIMSIENVRYLQFIYLIVPQDKFSSNSSKEELDMLEHYRAYKRDMKKLIKNNKRIRLIDFNDFVLDETDLDNSIRHYKPHVYHRVQGTLSIQYKNLLMNRILDYLIGFPKPISSIAYRLQARFSPHD